MLKILLAIILAVMVTVFAMDNMHHVELDLVLGGPAHVRLFFLLLTSFLVGCFSAALTSLYLNANSRERRGTEEGARDDDLFFE